VAQPATIRPVTPGNDPIGGYRVREAQSPPRRRGRNMKGIAAPLSRQHLRPFGRAQVHQGAPWMVGLLPPGKDGSPPLAGENSKRTPRGAPSPGTRLSNSASLNNAVGPGPAAASASRVSMRIARVLPRPSQNVTKKKKKKGFIGGKPVIAGPRRASRRIHLKTSEPLRSQFVSARKSAAISPESYSASFTGKNPLRGQAPARRSQRGSARIGPPLFFSAAIWAREEPGGFRARCARSGQNWPEKHTPRNRHSGA